MTYPSDDLQRQSLAAFAKLEVIPGFTKLFHRTRKKTSFNSNFYNYLYMYLKKITKKLEPKQIRTVEDIEMKKIFVAFVRIHLAVRIHPVLR